MMQVSGWGKYPKVEADVCKFESNRVLHSCLEKPGDLIAFGLGRSYGDSALSANIASTERFNYILGFDENTGRVTCEAGVSLAELIDVFVPRGWFLSITPGTKFITVGGAIACDVHGKNHHVAGCFSECVDSFEMMVADGSLIECSKEHNADIFKATCGGMGLTGVITKATLKLQKVSSANISQKIIRAKNLSHITDLFQEYAPWTYSVAWIDCLAKGDSLGRSLLMVGEHADDGDLVLPQKMKLNVPVDFPSFSLNKFTVKAFNGLYYNRVQKDIIENTTSIDSFFYPLDAVHNWNRIYGKSGFTQYQFVLPMESSRVGLTRILEKISGAGLGSFLAVLKLFGPDNDNYLSFPKEGLTLALDFKIERKLFALLDLLDDIVLDHGGRIYLTKDVRMKAETFRAGYPLLDKFMAARDKVDPEGKFQSLQSKRLGI